MVFYKIPDVFNSQGKASWTGSILTLSLLDRLKTDPLLFYSVKCQTILLVKGEPLGGKGLTGPICSFLVLNYWPPRPAKNRGLHFIILLCQTPERVNENQWQSCIEKKIEI